MFVVTSFSANYQPVLVLMPVLVVTSIVVTVPVYLLRTCNVLDIFPYTASFAIPVSIMCMVSFITYYNSMRQYYYYYLHFKKENTKF